MKNLRLITPLFIGCLFFANTAKAQLDTPTTGMLYNTQEASLLTYNCHKSDSAKLDCEFIQTSVRKKSKPAELEKKIEDAKKQFPDALKEISSDKSCGKELLFINPLIDVLSGKKTPEEISDSFSSDKNFNKEEFMQNMKESSADDKRELLKNMLALQNFCKEKTEESFLELTKLSHEKDSRTCIIAAGYSFTQTFTYVEDYSSGAGAWVVESKPEGPCGAVQLSRFVSEKTKIGDSEFTNWKYIAKKAITNRDGTFFGDFKCNQADENEYLYDWKTSTKTDRLYHLGCEFIEFSPL